MLLYMGIHMYSVNSHYSMAEHTCRRMLDILIKLRIYPYVPIFLIMMIKLKANQSQWEECLPLISRALSAAWLYKLNDL